VIGGGAIASLLADIIMKESTLINCGQAMSSSYFSLN
jgi:hypothetical protein